MVADAVPPLENVCPMFGPTASQLTADSAGSRVAVAVGSSIALTTAGVTVVTFALALTALPNDVPYPFASDVIADQWPGDYLWMFPAMLLIWAVASGWVTPAYLVWAAVGPVLIWLAHADNIDRLIHGQERKFDLGLLGGRRQGGA